MIKQGYKKEFKVEYSDVEQNMALKPFALLNAFQNIATDNAETIDLGYNSMLSRNTMWFLIKYHIEFLEYPFGIKDLILLTEPRGYNKLFVYRDFELWEKEKCIARASSVWAVIDTNTHSMLQPAVAIPNNPRIVQITKREDDLSFNKVKPVEKVDVSETYKVRYSDLDVNGHANNCNYILWALEPLDFEFKTNHKMKTLDMIFKKESRYGEVITSDIEFKDDLTTSHTLKNSLGEDLCIIECEWKVI